MPVEEIDLSNIEKYLDLNDVPESDFEPIKFKRGRPNYFLSIHLKSKNLQDIVKNIQLDLEKENLNLSDTFIDERTIHITLCVLCIQDEEGLDRALYECNTQLQTIVNSVLGDHNLVLTFENLSLIEDRVIYVDIRDDDEKKKLHQLGSTIIYYLQTIGLVVSPRDSLDWTIHTTIGKVSRASYRYNSYKELKEHKHLYTFPSSVLYKYKVTFGQYSVDEIEFNSMERTDIEYPVLSRIPLPAYKPIDTIETPASLKYITESRNKLVFSEKTYQCPYCDSSFFSILFLNRHKLVHQKEQQSDEPMLKPNLGLYMFKSIEKEEQKVDESTTEAKPSSVSVQVKTIEKETPISNPTTKAKPPSVSVQVKTIEKEIPINKPTTKTKPPSVSVQVKTIEKEQQADKPTTKTKPPSVSVQVKSIEKEPIVINVNVPLSTTHLLHLKDKTIEVTHEEYELILRAFPSYSSLPESVIRAYLPILKQKKH